MISRYHFKWVFHILLNHLFGVCWIWAVASHLGLLFCRGWRRTLRVLHVWGPEVALQFEEKLKRRSPEPSHCPTPHRHQTDRPELKTQYIGAMWKNIVFFFVKLVRKTFFELNLSPYAENEWDGEYTQDWQPVTFLCLHHNSLQGGLHPFVKLHLVHIRVNADQDVLPSYKPFL